MAARTLIQFIVLALAMRLQIACTAKLLRNCNPDLPSLGGIVHRQKIAFLDMTSEGASKLIRASTRDWRVHAVNLLFRL